MATLCVDVGNTSTHYGIVDGQVVQESGDFPTALLAGGESSGVAKVFGPLLQRTDGAAFCSVVPAANRVLAASLEHAGKSAYHLTYKNCPGLELAYPKPSEIGEDRLANAIGAQEYYGVPAVVIDMGTAVTFDIITKAGYEGGVIAPGIAVMTRYLHEQTALLPELKTEDLLQVDGAIGKSTVHAMKLGVAVGFSGMIEALLKQVLRELNQRDAAEPVVLATGGSTANLTADWAFRSRFVDDLTLIGLGAAWHRSNNQEQ